MDIRKKQLAVVAALEDVKARDIVVFNVARQTAYFERVVIASGDSSRQVNALATRVQERMKELGARIAGVEGRRNGEWVLVDLGDLVVHVMHPAVRSFYNLEELWGGKEVVLKQAAKPKRKAKAKPKRAPARKAPARGKTARPRRRK
jgi:ribosome-associated protein